jgi:IclR helix-turn-helix domain
MCRFLARKHRGHAPMTNAEIAAKSGLANSTVARICQLDSWDTLTVWTVRVFSQACGVNLLSPWRQLRFWRRNKLAYLGRGTPKQRLMFARLLSDITGNP